MSNSKRLLAYYDLRCAPLSFDFAAYLVTLVCYAMQNGFDKITLWIYAPFYRRANSIEAGYEEGYEDRKVRNVFFALAGLVPMIDDIVFTKSGILARAPGSFPVGYDPSDPALALGSGISLMPCTTNAIVAAYHGKANPRIFKPTAPGRRWLRKRYPSGRPIVTLSLRYTPHNSSRNVQMEDWYIIYTGLRAAFPGVEVVVIPDHDDVMGSYEAEELDWRLCPEAALDVELRMALYGEAVLNVAWLSGPTTLLMYSDANYLMFGIWNERSSVSTREFFGRKGPTFGEQLPWALPERQSLDWTHSPDVTAAHMTAQAIQVLKRLPPRRD